MTELTISLAPITPFVNVTGVILAGGRGQRMAGADKGWVEYQGRPLIEHALSAIRPVVGQVIISANRNISEYQRLESRVVTDQESGFQGPLAGIFSALANIKTDYVLVMPCDAPGFDSIALHKLISELKSQPNLTVVIAGDGKQTQPVFMALKQSVKTDLEAFLATGQRKLMTWVRTQAFGVLEFEDPTLFVNLNTAFELTRQEQRHT